MEKKLLSIITVCYNDLQNLKMTHQSISEQLEPDNSSVEWIVVDGLSNDGTYNILTEWKKSTKYLRFASQKDEGIYDAMNKGLAMAEGKWINFLNAGDTYHCQHTLRSVLAELSSTEADLVYGGAMKFDAYHKETVFPSKDLSDLKHDMIICHQAVFFNRLTHMLYPYDTRYRIVSDYNTVLRMYLDGKKMERIDIVVADYDMSGISAQNLENTYKEIRQVKLDNGVYSRTVGNDIVFSYGLLKRRILVKMPPKIRWKIAMAKHKLLGGEAKC